MTLSLVDLFISVLALTLAAALIILAIMASASGHPHRRGFTWFVAVSTAVCLVIGIGLVLLATPGLMGMLNPSAA